MRHALWLKFIAVMLCAAGLLAALGSGFALALLASENLLGNQSYQQYLAEKEENALSYQALTLAQSMTAMNFSHRACLMAWPPFCSPAPKSP